MNPWKYSWFYFNKQFLLWYFCDLLYERKNNQKKYLLAEIPEKVLCSDLIKIIVGIYYKTFNSEELLGNETTCGYTMKNSLLKMMCIQKRV